MILYFTGTGNSAFVAKGLSEKLGDECVSLNRCLKENLPPVFESKLPFVVVAPIYAWRFPRVVEELMERAEFRGRRELYCVGTMAAQSGSADKHCAKIADSKDMVFMGFRGVDMPSNFLPGGNMPSEELVERTLEKAIPSLDEIAEIIRSGEKLRKKDRTKFSWFLSGFVNNGFYKYMVRRQEFTVEPGCSGCGLCQRLCPVNNIRLEDGKPVFGDKCVSCYACIQHCPEEAINLGAQTKSRGRYTCPEYPNTRK